MKENYDNTNHGFFALNTRRRNDRSPEYTGTINVDGTDYWLNGWVKEGKHGKLFSLSVRPKNAGERRGDDGGGAGGDTDIPFICADDMSPERRWRL